MKRGVAWLLSCVNRNAAALIKRFFRFGDYVLKTWGRDSRGNYIGSFTFILGRVLREPVVSV